VQALEPIKLYPFFKTLKTLHKCYSPFLYIFAEFNKNIKLRIHLFIIKGIEKIRFFNAVISAKNELIKKFKLGEH
jgi:hypothetical protein